jgi:beta-lactam-binding protein with PASTA domain
VFTAVVIICLAVFRYQHNKATPSVVIVPNLKGLDLQTAEFRARQALLNPQVLLRRWDVEAPVGSVVGQIPESGASVPIGSPIGLELRIEDPNKPATSKTKH